MSGPGNLTIPSYLPMLCGPGKPRDSLLATLLGQAGQTRRKDDPIATETAAIPASGPSTPEVSTLAVPKAGLAA